MAYETRLGAGIRQLGDTDSYRMLRGKDLDITEATALTSLANADLFLVDDDDVGPGTQASTKKITAANLSAYINANLPDSFLINNGNDETSGTITAAGFTTTGTWTMDTSAGGTTGITNVNVGSAFTDDDVTLMSAGAIKEKIEGYGYSTTSDTAVNGATTTSISSNWAYDHNAGTGNGAHVPSAGSSGQFLAHNGAWATPPDTTTNTMGSGFIVSATTNTNPTTIVENETLTFTAGTGITCETTADGTVTITNTASSATPTDITVTDESSDTTCFPLFVTAATGNLAPKTDSSLTYDSTDGTLGCGILDVVGPVNAGTGSLFNGSLNLIYDYDSADGPVFNLTKTRGGTEAAVDDDELGEIRFNGENNTGTEAITYAQIRSVISEADNTDEAGKLILNVAASDGSTSSLNPGLILEGEHATGNEVDVTIGNGEASTTTIAGTLTMGSTATIDNSGVWVGGVIPSAKLDSNTAHLGGAQTFMGAKTFAALITANGGITSGFPITAESSIIMQGNRSVIASIDGRVMHIDAMDITDTTTAASGTSTAYNHVSIENPRLLASNALVTTTDASTLLIKGAPVASTNQTITNAWALRVAGGNCKFGGDLDVAGNVLPGITYVKILPSDFIPDDAGRPIMIDDTSSDRWLESHGTARMFASVQIPAGFKATHVDIYGDTASQVTVYEAGIDTSHVISKGTGSIGTQIDITDVTADATNYILIQLAQASGEKVYGGKLTIAKA
jgi:hypothetical protein